MNKYHCYWLVWVLFGLCIGFFIYVMLKDLLSIYKEEMRYEKKLKKQPCVDCIHLKWYPQLYGIALIYCNKLKVFSIFRNGICDCWRKKEPCNNREEKKQ